MNIVVEIETERLRWVVVGELHVRKSREASIIVGTVGRRWEVGVMRRWFPIIHRDSARLVIFLWVDFDELSGLPNIFPIIIDNNIVGELISLSFPGLVIPND